MDDSGEPRIPQRHAADLVQDTFEAAATAWATLRGHPDGRKRAWLHTARGKLLVAGLERYYPFGRDDGKGAVS
jgi:hypothetical protein